MFVASILRVVVKLFEPVVVEVKATCGWGGEGREKKEK